MTCPLGCGDDYTRHGKDRHGRQRYRCGGCGRTFMEPQPPRLLGDMRISEDKAILALHMLAEGNSIRGVERMTGLHRDTIMRLLVEVGDRCGRWMENRIVNVPCDDVQADEIWTYVGMKQRTKNRLKITDEYVGDAYCFVGIERNTKLILAWHLGKRTRESAIQFLDKLNWVSATRMQLSTDAWSGYKDTVHYCMGGRVDYATVEKRYAQPPRDEARYSPPVVTSVKKVSRWGNPDRKRICTSHIERQNLNIRLFIKRFTRLTLCFSRKWENLRAALGWFFAYHNFIRVHGSLRVTPAMEAGLTDHIWSIEEVLVASN